MILTFASSKGGVGKSTTCAAVASAMALDGARVIDLDQNRTLDRWSRKAPIPGLTVSAIEPQKFGAFFREQEASQEHDHICIDLPGNREVTLFKALARSDLVVIPAQASEARSARGARRGERHPRRGRYHRAQDPYRLLLTKVYPLRTRVTDFAYAELARLGLPLFRTALVERSAYREMFLNGQPPTVTEAGKGAGLEIQNLLTEIRAIVADTITEIRKAG